MMKENTCSSPSTVMLYALIISILSSFTKHTYSPSLAAVTGDIERYKPSFLTLVEPEDSALIFLPVFKKKKKTKKGSK